MSRLRVHNMTISLDGYAAGPDQRVDRPLGRGGDDLHAWIFGTPTGQRMIGDEPTGDEGIDDRFMAAARTGVGATIMGRNMFGPVRGPWPVADRPDEGWTGWWGPDPPFHHPVFVLTHHERGPVEMAGGTTFHFVTDGIQAALERATAAAGGADVQIGGGASTVQQYLRAGLIDDLHLVIAPVLLGGGERLFDQLDGAALGFEVVETVSSPAVTHVRLRRSG